MANNDNIIYAKFNHGRETTTDSRSQYAYGQVLKISGLHLPASFDADVSNKGDKQAKAVIGTDNELPIDDAFFLSGKDVIVMINVHAADKDGRTKYIIRIPVEKRPERADIELEPVEQDVISVAIATLNEAVEQTSASAESAENSANRAHESAINAETSATSASNSEVLAQQYMERAETAAENAEQSKTKAKASEDNAKASETHAEQIATEIEQYTGRAETASTNAQSSASTATQKATEASVSASTASTKANEASTSATNAQNSANNAQQSATSAQEFANSASASASRALVNAEKTQSDKEIVELAKSNVLSAVGEAQTYATTAQSASQAIQDMNVEAVTLGVDSDVTVEKTINPVTGAVTLTYGIPKGVKGEKGDTGSKGDKGDPFVYSDFTPEQLASLKGEKGDKGDQGIQGIQGIQGERGEKGDTGSKGDKGDTGAKGDKGDAFTYADFTPEQLASLKGEKGDKGDTGNTGAKGDTGDSGVYVGTSAPTDENVNVWINPDANNSDIAITVDPAPTQGSTNAVSSGGVYEALAGKVDVETGKGLSTNDYSDVEKQKVTDATADLSAMTTATAEDVGKALKAKTITNGKVIEWEFGEAGATSIIASGYKATSIYAVGDYCVYNNALYKCTTAIETAEAWNAEHWTEITVGDELKQNNERLDMLVTLQEVEPEPVPENVQIVNPANTTIEPRSSYNRIFIRKADISRDGIYYGNPYGDILLAIFNIEFYNEYDELITTTDKDGTVRTKIPSIGVKQNQWFSVEDNGYTIKVYVRTGELTNTYHLDSKVSYFGGNTCFADINFPTDPQMGLTYNEHYTEYVPYGDTLETPTEYELAYNLDLARFVQNYMETHGTGVSNRIYDVTYPEKSNSEFVNAVKYYHERAERQRNDIIRIGSFNKFVSRGRNNWSTIKQELADYSIDICGFQECAAIQSGGVVTTQIGEYLKGWQFKDYAVQDAVVDKALVSHWEVTQTDLITLLTYDNSAGTSNCIHALMTISSDRYYSHAINANAILSVYCYHGKSTGATIGGTSYSSYQVRQMEINALLAVIANDTADFIVIVGDTNAFESGFDIATGTHHEWEMFRNAGFTPVLDGYDSTVTADLQNKYFCKADNDKVYCIACYDQIFIGANITAEKYGVVDSNLYPVEALGGVPVSDHCMVYADLKFNFDAVQQTKLANIAVTTPWW